MLCDTFLADSGRRCTPDSIDISYRSCGVCNILAFGKILYNTRKLATVNVNVHVLLHFVQNRRKLGEVRMFCTTFSPEGKGYLSLTSSCSCAVRWMPTPSNNFENCSRVSTPLPSSSTCAKRLRRALICFVIQRHHVLCFYHHVPKETA